MMRPPRTTDEATSHKWEFKARFRRHAFGWKSQPAIQRVKQAVAEIRKVARKNAVLAADGAVSFIERVSPALERRRQFVRCDRHSRESRDRHTRADHRRCTRRCDDARGVARSPLRRACRRRHPLRRVARRLLGRVVRVAGGRQRVGRPPARHHAPGAEPGQGRPRALPWNLRLLERPLSRRTLRGDRPAGRCRRDLAVQTLGGEGARRDGQGRRGHPLRRTCRSPWASDWDIDGSAKKSCCPLGRSTRHTPATDCARARPGPTSPRSAPSRRNTRTRAPARSSLIW